MTPTKILMVCLGNICRSPLAEGILQSKVDANKVLVDSAGTASYHIGNSPDIRSIETAKKHGIDISHQKCRQFCLDDFDSFDYIFVMDQSNYKNVVKLARDAKDISKVQKILPFANQNLNDVPDPYYGEDDGFEHVYTLLEGACDEIVKKLPK